MKRIYDLTETVNPEWVCQPYGFGLDGNRHLVRCDVAGFLEPEEARQLAGELMEAANRAECGDLSTMPSD